MTAMRQQAPRLPGSPLLPRPLRNRLRRRVLTVISHNGPGANYDEPKGDPGLFGPDSVVWKVHADFPSMMVGGLAALLLQALHPLPLAAVWDHSSFRTDLLGRLRRTIMFVARTTYAPRAAAEDAMERVRHIHANIHGVAPNGQPYSAEDPHLLTWVHAAESWCFLASYQAYFHHPIPPALQDRYLAETALVAEGLGARNVPQSMDELQHYFGAIQGELAFDEHTAEVMAILQRIRLPVPLSGLARTLFFGAAAALLPDWALDMHGRSRAQRLRDRASAAAMRLIAPSMRDAMSVGGLAWRSCARTGADYEALFRWD